MGTPKLVMMKIGVQPAVFVVISMSALLLSAGCQSAVEEQAEHVVRQAVVVPLSSIGIPETACVFLDLSKPYEPEEPIGSLSRIEERWLPLGRTITPPPCAETITYSKPVIIREGKTEFALVRAEHQCGPLCGQEAKIYLTRGADGAWSSPRLQAGPPS